MSARKETRESSDSPQKKGTTSALATALLAAVPLGVALLVGGLLLPRAVSPDDVPIPLGDARALEHSARADQLLAEEARRAPLSADVRAIGSALRALNEGQAANQNAPELLLYERKSTLDAAVSRVLRDAALGPHALLVLRAVELETFLVEIARFEATGTVSAEMEALGSGFVPRMRAASWLRDHNRVVLNDAQRRAAFKMMWNATASVDGVQELALTTDETRAIYALYLGFPHPSESASAALSAARRNARDGATCASLVAGERVEAERWRIDKIKRYALMDPAYPASFAIGISNYRRGSFALAAENFRDWLRDHPNGAYALRARNYLKASIDADQGEL